jgi:small-conductance mechanosensitive channel
MTERKPVRIGDLRAMKPPLFFACVKDFWRLAGLLLCCAFASVAMAQTDAQTSPPTSAQQAVPQAVPQAAMRELDKVDSDLKATDATLQSHVVSDADLQALRDRASPLPAEVQTTLDHLNARLAAVKARLDQLGPAPAKGTPESAQIGTERQQQQQDYESVDALVKRAKLLLVQAQQANTRIAARQHAKFTHSLFERSPSLVDPDLWLNVVATTPHTLSLAQGALADRLSAINGGLADGRLPLFWLSVLVLCAAYWPIYRFARRSLVLGGDVAQPGRLRKITAAWLSALIIAGFPLLALLIIAGLFKLFGLFDATSEALLWALAMAISYVAVAAGLTVGLLSPSAPHWRLLRLSDMRCRQAQSAIVLVAALIAVSYLLVAACEAIGADTSYQTMLRGGGALCVAAAIITALWRANAADCGSEEIFGPIVTGSRDWYGVLRSLLWVIAIAIIVAVIAGYMRLACFLAAQIYWIGGTGLVAVMLFILLEEAIAAGCKPTAPFGRALMASLGLRADAIEQLAILLSGAATVTIFIAAVLTVLAPWGVQSSDLPTYLRSAFFGFRVGDITISLSAIIVAIGIFIAGSMATHAVERWLDLKFLPQTRLDTGLRNAIKTSFGYLGFILAIGFALAYLGLNFEKLAIVAGALSVGIGFGLQSIVNNFVSGLIVLWERAIRVGDWIVVGSDEGVVSRISVRATEIATFDRAAVIVPNSNLITGVVKNYVRTDRSGRIQIGIPVNAAGDPELARNLLLEIAKNHPLVLEAPAPQVIFSGITTSAFNFDLYCFIGDVSMLGSVKSELNFEIYHRFKAAGLFAAPPPQSVVTLAGLEKFEPLINKVVAADGLGNAKETG